MDMANTDIPPATTTILRKCHAELFITVSIRELSEIHSLSRKPHTSSRTPVIYNVYLCEYV